MNDKIIEFSYEDFVTDITNFLKKKERMFIETVYDGYNPYINENKLAILLSEFFIANQR